LSRILDRIRMLEGLTPKGISSAHRMVKTRSGEVDRSSHSAVSAVGKAPDCPSMTTDM
jgi:hypothetical protein